MKKKALIIIFIFCVLFSVGSIINDKIADNELTFEQKVLDIMNYDELTGNKNVDTITFLTEVDGGYFCVGTASSDETIHFGYIREENGKLEFGGKSFSSLPMIVNNEDPKIFLRTSILNFSKKDYYYGCYQHKNDIQLTVNGSDVETHSFNLTYNNKVYTMDFWLVCSENEPIVEWEE
ncbi:MAG: hypothetical protein IJZ57_08235 [Clostridia bacterium]|nr:hypothetical protein [Clostridia bacterium]